ncbi:probable leucine-rich repeat receptor-like protein kinase At5g49770 [Eucalyptus grandis]|uniref:probable leucine-rich repeat receptor-like protein kinase At5g49770 n=1 Tax=Eucalyptus grandis TaxID=71139 RepID=UPI00192EEAB8|nr:probable leucine-rich repeat receptor-like protein kinase At5g49770 [Eucalyptus grandis]
MMRLVFFLAILLAGIHVICSFTDPGDSAALQALRGIWQNTPPSWAKDDPCGVPWDGVTCNNLRVTALGLSSMNIKGSLSGDIGGLTELRSLDLSFSQDLTGSLTARLGDLSNLNTLILQGCGFTGNIPDELGKLSQLTFLALNNNKFTGSIPASLGNLSQLSWLDLAENQLTGSIPLSDNNNPGLDHLLNAKHFHFNKNQLSGPIPRELFSANMNLIHVLFDHNQFNGSIPPAIGLVQTLEVLRLDRNSFSGEVPSDISKLVNVNELNLAYNRLNGSFPDLSSMISLNSVDLSNNYFNQTTVPAWFWTLPSLTTLVVEYGPLQGTIPEEIFSNPQIQLVDLRNNTLEGALNMSNNIGPDLVSVDLQYNQISSVTQNSFSYTNILMLLGNPVCNKDLGNTMYCLPQQPAKSYTTSLASCGNKSCRQDQKLSPHSCNCAFPYEGMLYFRAPFFKETNANLFQQLEKSLWTNLDLAPNSVFIDDPFFNTDDYLQVPVAFFPAEGKYFNRSEIARMGFDLSNQTFKPPRVFGPYYFSALPYAFQAHRRSWSSGAIASVTVGCGTLLLGLIAVGAYAVRQKQRAEKAISLSKPFASWAPSGKDSGGAPQLKGARWFSYDELKRCTNNFSEKNEIGSGGYGKVYRGMLPNGQMIATKRAQQGSMQGGLEFKTEIELLSRVHHKNLVGLVGFCFEQGEQMLIYEFVPNGTLRASLSGKSGIHLDWRRRLRISLGSARGIAYLHDLANPPIIHRDIKSTNILLDENLMAKVADFGLSKLVSDSEKGHVSTQVKGTLGYLDPEYYMTQQLTEKSDVYSFGVVMLELITARQPIEKGKYIVREVRTAMDAKDDEYYGLREKIDPSIRNPGYLVSFAIFLELAMRCVEESALDRPTMSEVVKTIESILQHDGVNTNSTSASSSTTEFGASKGPPKHPYNDTMPKLDTSNESNNSFDYSGGYTVSPKIDPK